MKYWLLLVDSPEFNSIHGKPSLCVLSLGPDLSLPFINFLPMPHGSKRAFAH